MIEYHIIKANGEQNMVRVGELFVRHIHCYDNGETLRLALGVDHMLPTFGYKRGAGMVRATIGHGDIEVGSDGSGIYEKYDILKHANGGGASGRNNIGIGGDGALSQNTISDVLHRDINAAHTFDYSVNIDPITAYIPFGAPPALPKTSDGHIDWNAVAHNLGDSISVPFKELAEVIKELHAKTVTTPDTDIAIEHEETINYENGIDYENGDSDKLLLSEFIAALAQEYGDRADELIYIGVNRASQFVKALENATEKQYSVSDNQLVIALSKKGVTLANASTTTANKSCTEVALDILTSDEAKIAGKTAIKVGKYFVRLNPYVMALLTAYEVASYLIEHEPSAVTKIGEATAFARKIADKAQDKAQEKLHKTSFSTTSNLNPNDFDFEPDDENDDKLNDKVEKFKWEIKDSNDADKIVRHEKFGKFYRDPTQKIGNKDIWWTKDTARHRDTIYKIYIRKDKIFKHIADLDENGLQILKHKGKIGRTIPIKEFIGVK